MTKYCFCLLEDENKGCVGWCYPPTFAKKFNTAAPCCLQQPCQVVVPPQLSHVSQPDERPQPGVESDDALVEARPPRAEGVGEGLHHPWSAGQMVHGVAVAPHHPLSVMHGTKHGLELLECVQPAFGRHGKVTYHGWEAWSTVLQMGRLLQPGPSFIKEMRNLRICVVYTLFTYAA